jgi:SpoVK/Ycf46/Vps4 family AAA+-type ATPase
MINAVKTSTLGGVSVEDNLVSKIEVTAAEITRLQNSKKLTPEGQANLGGIPINVDSRTLLTYLRESASSLLTILEFADNINAAGRRGEERSEQSAQAIMPVVIKDLVSRLHKQENSDGKRIFADIAEYDLYSIYVAKHGNDFPLPDWEQPLRAYLHPTNRLSNLPNIMYYLYHSQSAKDRGQYKKFEQTYQTIKESLGKAQAGSQAQYTQLDALENLETQVRNDLIDSKDVDPIELSRCCEALSLEVTLNPEVTTAILDLYENIGLILEKMIPVRLSSSEVPNINIYELNSEEGASINTPGTTSTEDEIKTVTTSVQFVQSGAAATASNHYIRSTSFSTESLLGETQKEEALTQLIQMYLELRHALVSISTQYSVQHRNEVEYLGIQNLIKRSLESIFPCGNSKSRDLLLQLDNYKTPELEFLQAKLLTTKVVTDSNSSMRILVDQPEHIQLLEQLVKLGVLGEDRITKHLLSKLKGTALTSAIELCHQVKECLISGNATRLALIFDNEIEKYLGATSKTAVQGASLLLTLLSVSENTKIRRALRGRIKKIDEIPEVVNKTAEAAKSTGQFIEKLRIKITQCFEDTLDSYWGHSDIVTEFRKDIEEHLLLLKQPAAYAGITTKKVFKNGHLFYGPPGAGKTYLCVCAANTYGLPYLKISREEMAKAQMRAVSRNGQSDADSAEETLSKFLEEKAEAARKLQQLSGAPAAMMMIDEMEAEFLKRNPETSPRSELISTNIMLRVIEKIMAKYPEVIFVAATNHVDLVDPAAMRIGRYGFGKYLGQPDERSRIEIILGTLNELGYNTVIKEISDKREFQDIVKASDSLMPEAISLAINNMICVYRAKALEAGSPIPNSSEVPFELLTEAVERIKKQTTFKTNTVSNAEQSKSPNQQ